MSQNNIPETVLSDSNDSPFIMLRSYIEDLSFENFHPDVLMMHTAPGVRHGLKSRIEINGLTDDLVVVSILLNLRYFAQDEKGSEAPLCLFEMKYSGLFQIADQEIEGVELKRMLILDCTNSLLPSYNRAVLNITTEGFFGPLLLPPLDLEQLERSVMSEIEQ